jgi:hypothetical protein
MTLDVGGCGLGNIVGRIYRIGGINGGGRWLTGWEKNHEKGIWDPNLGKIRIEQGDKDLNLRNESYIAINEALYRNTHILMCY